ncbi:prepilin peptidase [Salmonella enterica subsp. enterica serovar Worthington]|uniref:Prepilin peptidase n=1 Tax=Salmonella enterica subsp. enterica serovar Ank TaxID=1173578 RepID=A0A5I2X7Z8_SALET|nr:prepilin peptidase [Salmonella enterica]EBS1325805.1 prepilin peptidase [Salmonella enterica subsp. enterica serovar Muenchen]EBV7252038.1 prepilin peptidase [Salmonella enterica subsp. enterica serovar Pomona]ECF3886446.1 prepilin peptidase [Salmonella enterica subsp. enterica serovar Ank]EDJ9085712.1 prepilin peptidase [Salmonella enterica subsp. enterica serovar Vitkin]EGI5053436.1 prepilin peptidase [Salmonella enterica subsp. enterica serovar Worthington]
MHFYAGHLFPPSVLAMVVFCGGVLAGALLVRQVRLYLATSGVDASRHPAVPVGIWLFAVTGLLTVMAPASGVNRAGMLLMCGFLLQLGVMDAVSGWLPRPFTVACLFSGMLFTLTSGEEPVLRLLETGLMAGGMTVVCFYLNRSRPRLGTGDVWLLCAQTAWLGLADVMHAAFIGLSGFLLWQWVQYRDWQRCGFLGPWLCAGCIPVIMGRLWLTEWTV